MGLRREHKRCFVGGARAHQEASDSERESASESLGLQSDFSLQSGSDTEGERASRPGSTSGWSSGGASSVCSGSLDASFYSSAHTRKTLTLMTMPMTLAFCHLALLWVREAVTLADLLRFVAEGHVPYVNAFQGFPEEMKPYGRDICVFRVESIPAHKVVQKEAHRLAVFLDLPAFPPITPDCLLHPSLLCLRYLIEANLPDELHDWVSKVIAETGIGAEAFLTYDPTAQKAQLLSYDLQAAALIVVTMKLLFKLDDEVEWTLCSKADDESQKNQGNESFRLWTWYKTVHRALELARQRDERDMARKTWKPHKPLYPSKKDKSLVLKRRRVVEQLQANFQKLCGSAPEPQGHSPSSFRFQWGEGGADGPSFHHQNLDHVTQERDGSSRPSNPQYWHTALRPCGPHQCGDHFPEVEPNLPRSYVWVLGLFSFLLGVKAARVHAEVCSVERLLVKSRPAPESRRPPARRERQKKRTAQTGE
ncbi:hypothetical protein SKAU_G00189270 [Synaphobranchus kaupii]|uniref:Rrn7/TAF1B C-terminal cyclin domain-containing protein n=1 Tax=Synaphobranchus kaupii TaxID=118154 RepID=A0A9Q1FD42_SYNKA|nr:hypothetical protein SKAU_G00189270 [Synaphobranchus kaupii]